MKLTYLLKSRELIIDILKPRIQKKKQTMPLSRKNNFLKFPDSFNSEKKKSYKLYIHIFVFKFSCFYNLYWLPFFQIRQANELF